MSVATGRESFRHEGARRVHVLDDVVLSEDGGVVTAIDPAAGTPRRGGDRPARDGFAPVRRCASRA